MATKKKGSKGRRPPPRPSSKSAKPQSKSPAKTQGQAQAAPATGGAAVTPERAPQAKAKSGGAGSTRAERIEAARRARERKTRITRIAVIGGIVVLLGVVTFVVVGNRQAKSKAIDKLETGSCNYDEKTDRDEGSGRNHVPGSLAYDTNPPSGGDHNPQAAPPGQFTAEQAPPDAQIVHSMEHGYVIVWYKPDLPEDAVNQLKAVAGKYPKDVLLVPRANMDKPVAVTAWHKRLLCQSVEAATLDTFVSTYRNQGPEKVPH